jgi:ferritin-like protein
MSSEQLHEDRDKLRPSTIDRHRAIVSIMEELEAVDWYDQRVDATDDPELAAILAHNRDEEKEHAAMTLEWLRRHDPVLDKHLRTYLFTTGSVLEIEERVEHGDGAEGDDADGGPTTSEGTLAIGDLKGEA